MLPVPQSDSGEAVGDDVLGTVVGTEVLGTAVGTAVGEAVGAQLSRWPQQVVGQNRASCGKVQHMSVGAVAVALFERVKRRAQTSTSTSAWHWVGAVVGEAVGAVGEPVVGQRTPASAPHLAGQMRSMTG